MKVMESLFVVLHVVGAGKTHTMEGSQEDPGINYRAMKELFRCISYRVPIRGLVTLRISTFTSEFSGIAYLRCT